MKQLEPTCPWGSFSSAALAPEARLWTIRSPFTLMEAKCSSLQLYIALDIEPVWPFNHLIQRFLCRSHILTTWPLPPEHKYLEVLLLKFMDDIHSCKIYQIKTAEATIKIRKPSLKLEARQTQTQKGLPSGTNRNVFRKANEKIWSRTTTHPNDGSE